MGFYFNITFVKKYLFGFTSREEESEILDNPEVIGKMAEVWDHYSDIKSKENEPDSNKMFQYIKEKANIPEKQIYSIGNYETSRVKWYKSSMTIAASALIILFIGTLSFYFYNKFVKNAYIEVISEKGQRKEFTLPDGSRVWLNSDTKIRYDKNFDKSVREVMLCGEAYFSVVKDASRPFIVKTFKLNIKVLGTVFNVKSYPGDKTIETTLVTGLVSIEKNNDKEHEAPILVKPKQKAVFSVAAEQIKVEQVNVDKTTSWKNGKLVIDNEPIDAVMAKLQRWYGVKVELVGKLGSTDDRYTFTVKDENIEEVINLLQLTSRITFKIEDLDGSHERIYEPKKNDDELIE